ncbi:hypothetical protein F5Y05DRAFT_43299 [Hypoxylon sp. FL0543]|nr:hypothetical protein F5Y05DRAFT_43299 [Hypoxylon sp. FL0543]
MAFVEIVFPQFKKGPEIAKQAVEKLPIAFKAFKDGGALKGLHGFIHSEDGKDVSSDCRQVIVLEWPYESAFGDFVKSPGYGTVGAALKPFATGPAELNLFETNDGSHVLGAGPVLEVLLGRFRNTTSDEDVKAVLSKIQSTVGKTNGPPAIYGSTLNLPEKKIGIIRGFTSKAELEGAKSTSSRQEILAEIGKLAEVTQLVAEVKPIPF